MSRRADEPDLTGAASHPIVDELRRLVDGGDYSMLLRRSWQLAEQVRRSRDHELLALDLGRMAAGGPISAIVAIESLAEVDHRLADDRLTDLLTHQEPLVRRHAAWRLGDRRPREQAVPALLDLLVVGGIDTMHAHRTLRRWSADFGHTVLRSAIARLSTEEIPAARARLVDLLGVTSDDDADQVLLDLVLDDREASAVRAAAIGALGQRSSPAVDAALQRLAAFDDTIGTDAALALSARLGSESPLDRDGRDGLRIAQLALTAGLDGQLSLGGRGDTGGVASLLVSLGEALARREDVEHVLTIGRGTLTDAVVGPLSSSRIPVSYGMVAFGDDARPTASANDAWEHLPAIERGIRRALRLAGPVDVVHLRMADAGTLAGADVAAESGVPICFSVAPDPHNVIESLQRRGELDDESFVRLARDTHVWFRARLIERIARDADQLALFPRSTPIEFLERIGIDGERSRQRASVVAEGIDISLLDRAVEAACTPSHTQRPGDVLDELAAEISPSRRGLPLVVSVGRLNPVKGMDRVVAAWAADPRLHDECNLVIVGGDLAAPSATEAAVLETIDQLVPLTDRRRDGVILLGGRPRLDIARLLISTVSGRTGDWAGGGVYVDGALKEEFGLAVLEALAAGLVVVAPSTGGPSTYVEHGVTGVLVDPEADLGVAIRDAFGLVARSGRAERARAMVEQRYSIETMAAQLVELYRPTMAMR
jgi:glycosyltransferase involved in cell wall biosynthesis